MGDGMRLTVAEPEGDHCGTLDIADSGADLGNLRGGGGFWAGILQRGGGSRSAGIFIY